ncbi:hypothetical protein BSKO_07229 [Bryopsis sp. KO-2023]|nr:hypothetical protein BSKO_07229 [Bryopsis sp. KO-2023]
MADFDLSTTISPYLDRHLVFPLLEFLQSQELYDMRDILEAKIELLKKTNMVDFAMDIYRALNETDDVPEEMLKIRAEVVSTLRRLEGEARTIMSFLQDPNNVRNLRQDKAMNQKYLAEQYQIGPEQIESLYQFARCQYQCGNYGSAAELLQSYRLLCTNADRSLSALWGRFAANVLLQNFDAANDDLTKLKEALENQSFISPLLQLQQRTWLMHWALFVFWNHKNGVNNIIDLFLQEERYLNALQTNAPHLLRYIAAAVIINIRRRSMLKELVRVIEQEAYEYSDPITDFIDCLYIKHDFDGAQKKLVKCAELLENDYFLAGFKDDFLENARLAIFETYCRIHQTIDIKTMSQKLDMDDDTAEKWVVNLIRNEKLDARVDSRAGTVVMRVQPPNVFEQIIDRTRDLSIRTFRLANDVVSGKATA